MFPTFPIQLLLLACFFLPTQKFLLFTLGFFLFLYSVFQLGALASQLLLLPTQKFLLFTLFLFLKFMFQPGIFAG